MCKSDSKKIDDFVGVMFRSLQAGDCEIMLSVSINKTAVKRCSLDEVLC